MELSDIVAFKADRTELVVHDHANPACRDCSLRPPVKGKRMDQVREAVVQYETWRHLATALRLDRRLIRDESSEEDVIRSQIRQYCYGRDDDCD